MSLGTINTWMYRDKWKTSRDRLLYDDQDEKNTEEVIRENAKKRREENEATISNTSYISKMVTTLMRHEMSVIAMKIKSGAEIKNYNKDIKIIMQIMRPYFDRNLTQKTENETAVSSEDVYKVLNKIVEEGDNAF